MRRPWRLIVIAVLLVAACATTPAPTPAPTPTPGATCVPNGPGACTTLDGMALGSAHGRVSQEVGLNPPPCENCTDAVGTARAVLERTAPNHPPLTAIDGYDPVCRGRCMSSGQATIFVFTFNDGTTLPIFVVCSGAIGAGCWQVNHYDPPWPS